MSLRLLNCLVIELPLLLDKWSCGGSGRAEIHWVTYWCSWYLQQAKVLANTIFAGSVEEELILLSVTKPNTGVTDGLS